MASIDMNRLMDNARIKLPGALDGVLQMEMVNVLNEFFNGSNLWYEDIPFQVTPTSDSYLENPAAWTYTIVPSQGQINRLMWVMTSESLPVPVGMPIPGELILGRQPSQADTYTARVALVLGDQTTREGYPDFPDWILSKYYPDLLDGILGAMMGQLAKPYSNPQLAQFHLRRFRSAISLAKVEAQHENVYRGQSWRFPQNFVRRRFRYF
jgi:hypothetical protein